MTGTLHKLRRLARIVAAFAGGLGELVLTRPSTRETRAAWISRFCRRVLAAIELRPVVLGPIPTHGAIISNHLTFLDILVHASVHPTAFISKSENKKIPLIGWIITRAGTLYVERGQGGSAERAAAEMKAGFDEGIPITFFPEGGTFQGDQPVMPFRSGLLANTLAAGAPVFPSYLRYRLSPEDLADGRTEHDDVHWGSVSLGKQISKTLALRPFTVELRFAPRPVAFSPAAFADRKIAAEEAQTAVLTLAQPLL